MRNRSLLLLIAGLLMLGLVACASAATPTPTPSPVPTPTEESARPSNPGDPGPAADMPGDVDAGKAVYEANCGPCHGQEGKGGIANPGSDDGTVPPLNPIDETMVNPDYKTFATNVDLFLEHGSTPAGSSPLFSMPNWGDSNKLTPQQIADVIAYVISLNK